MFKDETNVTYIGIIGTAGRTRDQRFSPTIFREMVKKAKKIIVDDLKLDPKAVHLVSGGAAVSDHVAVKLYKENDFAGLTEYLPCKWENGAHRDNNSNYWRDNPGKNANKYHKTFSEWAGFDSLAELDSIKDDEKVTFDTTSLGFFSRNTKIAKAVSVLIAFTWDRRERDISGGTRDTWKKAEKYKIRRIHVCIEEL